MSAAVKTKYVRAITAADVTHDVLSLTSTNPTSADNNPGPFMGQEDSITIEKPHSYVTGAAFTVTYEAV